MKGKILGFDGTSGAIVNDADERFTFDTENWKGERPPQPRDEVDFVGADGRADQIYLLRGASAFGGGDLSASLGRLQSGIAGAADSGSVERVVALLKRSPQAICAIVVLLASFLFTFASFSVRAAAENPSLIGFSSALSKAKAQTEAMLAGIGGDAINVLGGAQSSGHSGLRDAINVELMVLSFSWLLYLIPLLAIGILYFTYRDQRMRLVEIGFGALCLLSGVYYFLVREATANIADNVMFGNPAAVRATFSLELGGWIIVVSGVIALLVAVGIIKPRAG